MQSFKKQKLYFLRADANALGGYLQEPLETALPTLAPVSLPPVGGFATARSGAFTFEEIVSCSAAYTRVSGREHPTDGWSSILVTAVVENLNILEVVRAERIAMQLSISLPREPGPIRISLAGSAFEGLRIAGQECRPRLSPGLQHPKSADGLVTWEDAWRVGRTQAEILRIGLTDPEKGTTDQWTPERQEQMAGDSPPSGAGPARCSLIDTLETSGANPYSGHVVEIPEFGRIILGELLFSSDYVQVVGIRADLEGPVCGAISSNGVGGGGVHDDGTCPT